MLERQHLTCFQVDLASFDLTDVTPSLWISSFIVCVANGLRDKNRLRHNIFNTNARSLMRRHIVDDRDGEFRVRVRVKPLNEGQSRESLKSLTR